MKHLESARLLLMSRYTTNEIILFLHNVQASPLNLESSICMQSNLQREQVQKLGRRCATMELFLYRKEKCSAVITEFSLLPRALT